MSPARSSGKARVVDAKDRAYFQMLRDADAELERQGVGIDEKLYAGLIRWTKERERRLTRAARRKQSG